jgi:hypothetical protein
VKLPSREVGLAVLEVRESKAHPSSPTIGLSGHVEA